MTCRTVILDDGFNNNMKTIKEILSGNNLVCMVSWEYASNVFKNSNLIDIFVQNYIDSNGLNSICISIHKSGSSIAAGRIKLSNDTVFLYIGSMESGADYLVNKCLETFADFNNVLKNEQPIIKIQFTIIIGTITPFPEIAFNKQTLSKVASLGGEIGVDIGHRA